MIKKEHWIYKAAVRLWPSIKDMDEPEQIQAVTMFAPLLTLLPFAIIGLIWLILVTDFEKLSESMLAMVIGLITLILLQNQPFTVRIKLGEDDEFGLTSSLAGLVIWSAALLAGPSALWIIVLSTLIDAVWQGWRRSRHDRNPLWSSLTLFVQVMSGRVFAILVALTVYVAAGGIYPLEDASLSSWLPVLYATVIGAIIPGLLLLPSAIEHHQLVGKPNTIGYLTRYFVSAVGLTLIMAPFSLLAVLIFLSGRVAALVVFMAGVFLVNALAHYLSQSRDRNRRRAREFAELGKLGEEILKAPVDTSSLSEILATHISKLFSEDHVEIRLFDLDDNSFWEPIHLWRPRNRQPVDEKTWQDMCDSPDSSIVIPKVILPGHKAPYGDAILEKIVANKPGSDTDESICIGGIYLLRHPDIGRTQDAVGVVQSLASQMSSAIYRIEVHQEAMERHKMEKELEFAGQIQASFLPKSIPEVDGWQLTAVLESARQTSGDFYDFIPLGDNRLGILVADVSDKGTGAALYMALSRTLIRTYAMEQPNHPEIVLAKANDRIMADSKSDQFVTAFYGVLDYSSGLLTYSNAGHNPPYLLRGSNESEVEPLGRTGIPVGMFEEMKWQQTRTRLNPGDVLLLYTDGVTEAQNTLEDLYDDERLLSIGKANLDRSAGEIQDAIIESINDFVGEAPQFDDITLMVVTRNR